MSCVGNSKMQNKNCVNEIVITYTRKYSPTQKCMKVEPCCYGMKIQCLPNAKSKFVQKMKAYTSASHEDVKHTTRYKIVYGLMDMCKNKSNHIVTCDNFFSNPTLFWDLLKVEVRTTRTHGIDCKGQPNALTIDPKRG